MTKTRMQKYEKNMRVEMFLGRSHDCGIQFDVTCFALIHPGSMSCEPQRFHLGLDSATNSFEMKNS